MDFPDPRHAPQDVIALGGDLSPETLIDAYSKGIFPWPVDEYPLCWFSPRRRAVLRFEDLHVSRSLRKARRRSELRFTIDDDFRGVIEHCSSIPRPDQEGTWILPEIKEAYTDLHQAGRAHSVEAWREERLVGGLYGIDAGGVFSGESMFHLESDASKLALLFLVDYLESRGARWIDVQIITPHMRRIGARLISRARFLDLLKRSQESGVELFPSLA